eukprot:scaffold41549_cov139-Skeletonema_marinoi.AAC.2
MKRESLIDDSTSRSGNTMSQSIKTPNRAVKIAAEAEMKKDDDDHEILEIITARHHSTYQPCDNTTQATLH